MSATHTHIAGQHKFMQTVTNMVHAIGKYSSDKMNLGLIFTDYGCKW